jgi:hypothetical protein
MTASLLVCDARRATVAGLIDVIGVEHVDFVSVPARDLARSRRFYGEVLGLPRSRTSPDEFEAGNVTLMRWQAEAQNVRFSPNTPGIALRVAVVLQGYREVGGAWLEQATSCCKDSTQNSPNLQILQLAGSLCLWTLFGRIAICRAFWMGLWDRLWGRLRLGFVHPAND